VQGFLFTLFCWVLCTAAFLEDQAIAKSVSNLYVQAPGGFQICDTSVQKVQDMLAHPPFFSCWGMVAGIFLAI
jgi:hypothetical protein